MATANFTKRCLNDTLAGLREGLSLFTGAPSRVAVIYCETQESVPHIFDPQGLLSGHAPKIQSILHSYKGESSGNIALNTAVQKRHIDLDGLVSFSGSSQSLFYQAWFTEHHPTLCSTAPIACWLEHAMQCLASDLYSPSELYTGISGKFLREYATHAVRDALVDSMNMSLGIDIHMRTYPILHAILEISKLKEEGALACGRILFAEPRLVLSKIKFLAQFSHSAQPLLTNHKHVRKTLQAVESIGGYLVSDGIRILGVAMEKPDNCLSVQFQGKLGFLKYNNELIASISNAGYCNNTLKAKLVEIEYLLLDYPIDAEQRNELFKTVEYIVHNSQERAFGACVILDLAQETTKISGQNLSPTISLTNQTNKELACALSKVDGAIHITADLELQAFACLTVGESKEKMPPAEHAIILPCALHTIIPIALWSWYPPIDPFRSSIEEKKYS